MDLQLLFDFFHWLPGHISRQPLNVIRYQLFQCVRHNHSLSALFHFVHPHRQLINPPPRSFSLSVIPTGEPRLMWLGAERPWQPTLPTSIPWNHLAPPLLLLSAISSLLSLHHLFPIAHQST